MIVLSAGCASLAALMRDAEATPHTTRAPVETDRRPRLIAMNGGNQRVVWVSPARQTR
jgi:hypothetical protein